MVKGREIITLQLGHYSNFVGTHWWNIQEASFRYDGSHSEFNHDVLYREGLFKNEVTFTPRLLLVDFKGSLASLSTLGGLYSEPTVKQQELEQWEGNIEIHNSKPTEKNKYLKELDEEENAVGTSTSLPTASKETIQIASGNNYNLDSEVTVWSDYLHSRLHPRTITELKNYVHKDEVHPFETYIHGSGEWKHSQEDFTDRIRSYAEECDCLQGFQVLLDCYDGFSGYSCGVLTHIQDEYNSKGVFAIPTMPAYFEDTSHIKSGIRVLNMLMTFNFLSQNSNLFIPVGLNQNVIGLNNGKVRLWNNFNYNENLHYHTSAILAGCLDTITLPYRLHETTSTLHEMADGLCYGGHNAAGLSVVLPFPTNNSLLITLNNYSFPPWQSVTPSYDVGVNNTWIQSLVIRGCGKNAGEILKTYLHSNQSVSRAAITEVDGPLKMDKSYPKVFQSTEVKSAPVISGIHNSPEIGDMLKDLAEEVKKRKLHHFHSFFDAGMEQDEFEDIVNGFQTFQESYTLSSF